MDIDSITNLGNFGLSIVLVFMLLKFVMTTVKDMLINLTKMVDSLTNINSRITEIERNEIEFKNIIKSCDKRVS